MTFTRIHDWKNPLVPPKTIIEAVNFAPGAVDDNTTVPPGTLGVVQAVQATYGGDKFDTLWVKWNNGSQLNVLIEFDAYKVAMEVPISCPRKGPDGTCAGVMQICGGVPLGADEIYIDRMYLCGGCNHNIYLSDYLNGIDE